MAIPEEVLITFMPLQSDTALQMTINTWKMSLRPTLQEPRVQRVCLMERKSWPSGMLNWLPRKFWGAGSHSLSLLFKSSSRTISNKSGRLTTPTRTATLMNPTPIHSLETCFLRWLLPQRWRWTHMKLRTRWSLPDNNQMRLLLDRSPLLRLTHLLQTRPLPRM